MTLKPASSVTQLIACEDLSQRVDSLAGELANIMPKHFTMIVLLKGAFVFGADLYRALGRLGMRPELDFMRLSSYGKAKTSSGEVLLTGSIPEVVDRDLLLVDDILDTGRSLQFANDYFLDRGAKSIRSCVLLDKPSRRVVSITADHIGFSVPDQFIVGYGIDYAEDYRYLPYIAVINESH